jgi:hypothetical protein
VITLSSVVDADTYIAAYGRGAGVVHGAASVRHYVTAMHDSSSELSSIAHIQCTCKAIAKPAPSPGGMWLDGLEGFAVLLPSSLGGVAQAIDRCRTLTLAQTEPCDTTSIKRNLYSLADLNCAREVSVKLWSTDSERVRAHWHVLVLL